MKSATRILAVLLCVVLAAVMMPMMSIVADNGNASIWDGTASNSFESGKGTADDPFVIATAQQLAYLAQDVHSGNTYEGYYFKLAADIDLAQRLWLPIGTGYEADNGKFEAYGKKPFMGNFDGDNHVVANLYMDNSGIDGSNSVVGAGGLFGNVEGGVTIENVVVFNGAVETGGWGIGGLIGRANGGSEEMTIRNCHVIESRVTAGTRFGGLIGIINDNVNIIGCSVNKTDVVQVNAEFHGWGSSAGAGGLVGYSERGTDRKPSTISDCYAYTNVNAFDSDVGGIIGYADKNISIHNCWAGSVSAYTMQGTFIQNTGDAFMGGIYGRARKSDDAGAISAVFVVNTNFAPANSIQNAINGTHVIGGKNIDDDYAGYIQNAYYANVRRNGAVFGGSNSSSQDGAAAALSDIQNGTRTKDLGWDEDIWFYSSGKMPIIKGTGRFLGIDDGSGVYSGICTHEYKSTVTKEPTCYENGVTTYTCRFCGISYTEAIEAYPHSWNIEWKSDDNNRTMYHTCSRCGTKSNAVNYHAPLTKQYGFTVTEDGRVLFRGEEYISAGTDWYDAATAILDAAHARDTAASSAARQSAEKDLQDAIDALDTIFSMLKEYNIPYIRFNAVAYDSTRYGYWYTHTDEYFEYMDIFAAKAKEYGIGLIPSLFWSPEALPEYLGEPLTAMGDPNSKTVAVIKDMTEKFVLHYMDNSIIYAWEFGNEYNLRAEGTDLKIPLEDIAYCRKVFVDVIRQLDPYRAIGSGDSIFRPQQWNLHTGRTAFDTLDEVRKVMDLLLPEGMNMLSVHIYDFDYEQGYQRPWVRSRDLSVLLGAFRQVAAERGAAIYIGEYGGQLTYAGNSEAAVDNFIENTLKVMIPQILAAQEKNGIGVSCYWSIWTNAGFGEDVNYIAPGTKGEFILDLLKEFNDKHPQPEPEYMIGDINLDGRIDGMDSVLLLQSIAGWDLTGDINLDLGDVNGDGLIDGRDTVLMLQYLAGWFDEFPAA